MVSPKVFNYEGGKPYEPIYLTTVIDGERDRTSENLKAVQKWLQLVFYILLILSTILFFQMVLGRLSELRLESKLRLLSARNEEYKKMFNEFVKKYDRKYADYEEYDYRLTIFKNTIQEYEEEEKRHPGLDLDVTQFADWTDEELRQMTSNELTPKNIGETSRIHSNIYNEGESRPASFDWRDQGKLTPVKNQASCGSCWAFATVAAVEAQHAIKKGNLVSLSEQEMVDCDHNNNGCHGGYRPYAMDFVKRKGLETDKEYPYDGIEGQQCRLENNLTRVFIDDYQMLGEDEEYIADWVSKNGPVTFGMNVTKSMYSYRSGIFNPSPEDCEEKSMGSHALTIVGYGVEGNKPFWIVKNSWGSTWGASGYFRLARGVNSCGLAKTVVAPIIR